MRAVNLVAGAVVDLETGLVLLAVDRETTELYETQQALGPARLLADLEAVLAQRADELRQLDIAEPLVIGPALGELDRLARPALDRGSHAAVQPLEQHRLEMRVLHLPIRRPAQQPEHRQHDEQAQHA